MFLLWLGTVAGVLAVVYGIKYLIKKSRENAIAEAALQWDGWPRDFTPTRAWRHWDSGIAWDHRTNRICLLVNGRKVVIPARAIKDVSFFTPTNTKTHVETTTSRGSQIAGAAVGAAIAGPAGLIVGGLSGKTISRTKVTNDTIGSYLTIRATPPPKSQWKSQLYVLVNFWDEPSKSAFGAESEWYSLLTTLKAGKKPELSDAERRASESLVADTDSVATEALALPESDTQTTEMIGTEVVAEAEASAPAPDVLAVDSGEGDTQHAPAPVRERPQRKRLSPNKTPRKAAKPRATATEDRLLQDVIVATDAPSTQSPSVADELDKLSKLLDRGVITPKEFAAQKKKLLK